MPVDRSGECLELRGEAWRLVRLLGRGKAGHSWLVEGGRGRAVFKRMHDEPCPYYEFHGSKLERELGDRARLEALGVPMPVLLAADGDDPVGPWLLKSWIDGPTAAERAAEGGIADAEIEPLFELAARLEDAGLNLDWFPANFVFEAGRWVYVDWECHPFRREWGWSDWGLVYWANGAGCRAWLATGDGEALNRPGEGRPREDGPWMETVRRWRELFGREGVDGARAMTLERTPR